MVSSIVVGELVDIRCDLGGVAAKVRKDEWYFQCVGAETRRTVKFAGETRSAYTKAEIAGCYRVATGRGMSTVSESW